MKIILYIGLIYFFFYNYTSIICKKILKYLDFKINIDISNTPSKLIIISSHTTIYDFFIGMIIYYGYFYNKYKLFCLMKKLFESIITPFLIFIDNKVQIISVNPLRNGLTQQIIEKLKNKDNFCLFIAPEGTRKLTTTLRKGYWIISKELNIDVAYLGIDFHKKIITLEKERKVNDDWNIEQEIFIKDVKKYTPLYPEKCFWTKDYYHLESLSSS